jgi:tetratricopeptide (TPR) repeat protein
MDWKNLSLACVVATLFVLQGVNCWRANNISHSRMLAILTLLFAGLGLSSHFLMASGRLVFSPEYGVVIVEGTSAAVALFILLVGIPVAAGVGTVASRAHCGLTGRWYLRIALGVTVGIVAASRVVVLDPGVELDAPIRAYDVWWPLSPLWLGLCAVDALTSLVTIHSRTVKARIALLVTSGFACLAVYRSSLGLQYPDPWTEGLWQAALRVALPAFVIAVVHGLLPSAVTEWISRRLYRVLIASAAAVSIAAVLAWIAAETGIASWQVWLAAALVSLVHEGLVVWRHARRGQLTLPDVGRAGRMDDLVALAAVVATGVGLVDAVYFRRQNAILDLVLVLGGWATLLEVLTQGPISGLLSHGLPHTVTTVSTVTYSGLQRAYATVALALTAAAGAFKWFFSFSSVGVAVVRVLLVAIVCVAIAEVPNAGKTIILPFTELGLTDDDSKEFGRMISYRVVNTFGMLSRDLQPEMAFFTRAAADSKDRDAKKLEMVSGDDGHQPEAVVSGDLEIPGIKIPLSLITSWIQAPMRALLRVRAVTGSIQRNGNRWVLLAQTSDGGSFRVEYPRRETADAAAPPERPDRTVAADELASDLAYQLIAMQPDMARTGMTRSWQAAPAYVAGLKGWQAYTTSDGNHDRLTEAITSFRDAVRRDTGFALAYYRLGLSLVEDGQPFLAAQVLRRSIQANPEFAVGYNALASHVYFSSRVPDVALPDVGPAVPQMDATEADNRQAWMLWHAALRLPPASLSTLDRAAAYYGLCRMIVDGNRPYADDAHPWVSRNDAQRLDGANDPVGRYLAYFHCHRALQLYATLPATIRNSTEARQAEATAWNTAGYLLNATGLRTDTMPAPDWICDAQTAWLDEPLDAEADPVTNTSADAEKKEPPTVVVHRSPYSRDALAYYTRARMLQPDDHVISCNWANTAFGLGELRPMDELNASSMAHLRKGEELIALIGPTPDPRLYRLALSEFAHAVQLDPQNLLAYNSYSYAAWTWHLNARGHEASLAPPPDLFGSAEWYASHSARLARSKTEGADLATYQSTLGEVLMMHGRWDAAYVVLEQALAATPQHPLFDEIRWDLAVAASCAAVTVDRANAADKRKYEAKAAEMFEMIRDHDERRELPFSAHRQILSVEQARELCAPLAAGANGL